MGSDEDGRGPEDGSWTPGFTGSASSGLVCRECHALVAWRGGHPQAHLAWHASLAARLDARTG